MIRMVFVVLTLLLCIILTGCSANDEVINDTTPLISISPYHSVICTPSKTAACSPSSTAVYTPSAEITQKKENNLSENLRILKDGKTLEDLSDLLSYSKAKLSSELSDYTLKEYNSALLMNWYYPKLGISFISFDSENKKFDFIECDDSAIDIEGVPELNLDTIKKVFGETEEVVVNLGLPELNNYMLNYQIENSKLTFLISNDDIKLMIVNEFNKAHCLVNINVEQIGKYFDMSRNQIETTIGPGFASPSGRLVNYVECGVIIQYNKDNLETVEELELYDFYTLEGLKKDSNFSDVIKAFGKQKIKKEEMQEDGTLYYLKYNFGTYSIRFDSFDPKGKELDITIYRDDK